MKFSAWLGILSLAIGVVILIIKRFVMISEERKQKKEEERLENVAKEKRKILKESELWNTTWENNDLVDIIYNYADFDKDRDLFKIERLAGMMEIEKKHIMADHRFARVLQNERALIREEAWLAKYQQLKEKYDEMVEKYPTDDKLKSLGSRINKFSKDEEICEKNIKGRKTLIKQTRYIPYISYAFASMLIQVDNIDRDEFYIKKNISTGPSSSSLTEVPIA